MMTPNDIIIYIQKSVNVAIPIVMFALQSLKLAGVAEQLTTVWVPIINEVFIGAMAIANIWANGVNAHRAKCACEACATDEKATTEVVSEAK
jgi:hypothetical protein